MTNNIWDDTYTVRNTYNLTNLFREYLNGHRSAMLTRSASGDILKTRLETNNSTDSNNVDPYICYIGLFSANSEQEYHLLNGEVKVLLYDSRTGYFNGTHLVQMLSDIVGDGTDMGSNSKIPQKEFSKLLHFSGFVNTIEILEQQLNAEMSYVNKSLPNYDPKRAAVVACYNLKHELFSGTYVHPSLLSFVIMYANPYIMLDMSQLMLQMYCEQVEKKRVDINSICQYIQSLPASPDTVRSDKVSTYKHDLITKIAAEKVAVQEARKRKKEADKKAGIKRTVKKRTVQPKFTTDTVKLEQNGGAGNSVTRSSSDIDLSGIGIDDAVDSIINDIDIDISAKENAKKNVVKSTVKTTTVNKKSAPKPRRRNTAISAITQALIIIIPSNNNSDMQHIKFITCLLEDLPKYQKQIPRGWVIHTTFINLRNLPTDLARRFNKDYEDTVETDIEIDTNGEVMLLIDSLESFDENIGTFLSDWMIV